MLYTLRRQKVCLFRVELSDELVPEVRPNRCRVRLQEPDLLPLFVPGPAPPAGSSSGAKRKSSWAARAKRDVVAAAAQGAGSAPPAPVPPGVSDDPAVRAALALLNEPEHDEEEEAPESSSSEEEAALTGEDFEVPGPAAPAEQPEPCEEEDEDGDGVPLRSQGAAAGASSHGPSLGGIEKIRCKIPGGWISHYSSGHFYAYCAPHSDPEAGVICYRQRQAKEGRAQARGRGLGHLKRWVEVAEAFKSRDDHMHRSIYPRRDREGARGRGCRCLRWKRLEEQERVRRPGEGVEPEKDLWR